MLGSRRACGWRGKDSVAHLFTACSAPQKRGPAQVERGGEAMTAVAPANLAHASDRAGLSQMNGDLLKAQGKERSGNRAGALPKVSRTLTGSSRLRRRSAHRGGALGGEVRAGTHAATLRGAWAVHRRTPTEPDRLCAALASAAGSGRRLRARPGGPPAEELGVQTTPRAFRSYRTQTRGRSEVCARSRQQSVKASSPCSSRSSDRLRASISHAHFAQLGRTLRESSAGRIASPTRD